MWNKGYISVYYKFVWQSMVVNDLSDYSIYKIFCWIEFIDKDKFAIFDKMFYNDKDTVIAGIVDKVPRFK